MHLFDERENKAPLLLLHLLHDDKHKTQELKIILSTLNLFLMTGKERL